MTDTVHIVDDDAGVRDSLRILFESAGLGVRTYPSAAAFLAVAGGLTNACALIDVQMPDIDGLGLQRRLNEQGVRLPVVVMTGHGDIPLAVQAMKAGAVDFLEKPFQEAVLMEAVRRALAAQHEWRAASAAAAAAAAALATLTPREREVLDEMVAGHPTKVIAHTLGASPRTIEVHRARVMEKLGQHSLPDLVRLVLAAQGTAAPPA
jgi:two-component system response regulator FixJ